jgi:hypothetical protein
MSKPDKNISVLAQKIAEKAERQANREWGLEHSSKIQSAFCAAGLFKGEDVIIIEDNEGGFPVSQISVTNALRALFIEKRKSELIAEFTENIIENYSKNPDASVL